LAEGSSLGHVARGVSRCPNCGEPVSQFAAGCAICGANLTAARLDRERRRQSMRSIARLPGWLPRITGADALLGVLLLICAIFSPLIGGAIAGAFAYFAHQRGDVVQRNLALTAVAVALVMLILVSFLPGTYLRLVAF
jgi:hypothetical protein